MVTIATGAYTPLFQGETNGAPIPVVAFALDVYPVTNAQYLAFVTTNPRWERTRVPPILADQSYLKHWQGHGVQAAPTTEMLHNPVTNVSWFAAKAYCQWQHKRLPRVAEWEYAAQASADTPDGRSDPSYVSRMLAWYAVPSPPVPPPVGSGEKNYWGVYDLHGVVWEWVADFNTTLVTGESRGDSDFERNLFCGAGAVGVTEAQRVNYPAFMRYAYRSSLQGHYTVNNLGFRCAKDLP
jgi:formylglycine-generating enzyme required for sulfatase activity